METAQSIINDSLQEILVQSSEQSLQPVDFQVAKRYFNRMMATTPFNDLGFTEVVNPDDLITVPAGAIIGIIKNLAKSLLTTYAMPLTAELAQDAREGLQEIRRLTVTVQPTVFPCTLPIGSGNEQENTFNNQHFYPCPEEELLDGRGDNLLVGSETDG